MGDIGVLDSLGGWDGWNSLDVYCPASWFCLVRSSDQACLPGEGSLVLPGDRRSVLTLQGEPAIGREHRAATLYSDGSIEDPDHEAAMRFGGEAPGRRAHSGNGIEAMVLLGSPPPRIVNSSPSRGRDRVPKSCLRSSSILPVRPPAAAPRPPARCRLLPCATARAATSARAP